MLPGIGPLPTLAPKRRISAALFRLSIGNRPVEGDAFVQRPADAKRLQGGNNCNRILVAEHRIMSPRSVSRNRAGPAIAVGASAIVARQHTEIISEAMREFGRPLHGGPAKVRVQVTVIRSMRMSVRCVDVFEAKDDRRAPTPDAPSQNDDVRVKRHAC